MAEFVVNLPTFGDDEGSATVTEVFCTVGDAIERDDDLIEIVTDKAAFTVPCPATGVVKSLAVGPDDEIAIGARVCTLEVDPT